MNLYDHYQAVDFAQNESFQQWILGSHPEVIHFWTRWLAEHPEKQAEVDEARRLVLLLGRQQEPIETWRATQMKRSIFEQLSLTVPIKARRRQPWWRWAAACLLALLLVGGSFWGYQQWVYVTYATPYGKKQTFTLPDGSEVTLKANSRLRYPRNWLAEPDREVWLEGEAFFHVQKKRLPGDNHTKEDERLLATFVVHATEMVDVAVLGTEFNVSTRDQETEVILKSGSVRLDIRHEQQPKTVLMEPGDLVAVRRQGTVRQQHINLQTAVDLQDNILIFNELTLAEVAEKLHDSYGVDIVFEDSTLAQRKFKGFVPADNLDVLLEAFANLYDINIDQEGDQLIFSKQSNP